MRNEVINTIYYADFKNCELKKDCEIYNQFNGKIVRLFVNILIMLHIQLINFTSQGWWSSKKQLLFLHKLSDRTYSGYLIPVPFVSNVISETSKLMSNFDNWILNIPPPSILKLM